MGRAHIAMMPDGYIKNVLGPREKLLDEIMKESLLSHGLPPMQVDDNAARFLQLLTMIHRPQRVIEVGTFFGYSAIHIARGLPEGGRLITLEIDSRAAELARRNLDAVDLGDRVEVVVGDAADYLARVQQKAIDMIFIDADKRNYPTYLKLCFPLLRVGGLLVADDAFARGDFSSEARDEGDGGTEIRAINTYNRAVGKSPHLFSAFVGTNNGLLVSYKR
jgi:caffeoyl-CoA O-methyltransferase